MSGQGLCHVVVIVVSEWEIFLSEGVIAVSEWEIFLSEGVIVVSEWEIFLSEGVSAVAGIRCQALCRSH